MILMSHALLRSTRIFYLCCAMVLAGAGCKGDKNPDPPPGGSDPVCGNGIVEDGEACDDGNTTSGDGCSSSCELEDGWDCPIEGEPCIEVVCGDGILSP